MVALKPQTIITGTTRYFVLSCATLAWLCAGIIMAVPPLAARTAVAAMGVSDESLRGRWFSWYVCAFLLGAAAGGFIFGWIGDRWGRAKALGWSVLTYSIVAGLCYFVTTPEQLLVLWFLACTGVGGVWPNGVSLASEALPGVSRAMISGFFGAAANVGLILLAVIVYVQPISVEHWRWIFLVCACPALLGILVLAFMPESPAWLAARSQPTTGNVQQAGIVHELLRPPLLRYTIIGILLGAVPLMGNWGSANWLVPWANQAQEQAGMHGLSAATQWAKSSGALVGSLFGGWIACACGRRLAYFMISLASLASSFYIFHNLSPLDDGFLAWVFVQGIVGTVYFGWLPLYLPELFPTRVRATGIGVAFNWGRILTAVGVLWGGQLMMSVGGDYARVGRITCLVYVIGMIVICFAPNTTHNLLNEPVPSRPSNREMDDATSN